jgi:transcriptional regulator with XRE-family HTH domain
MPVRDRVPVDRIRQLLAQGLTQGQVATRLGVSKGVVCAIAGGRYKPANSAGGAS